MGKSGHEMRRHLIGLMVFAFGVVAQVAFAQPSPVLPELFAAKSAVVIPFELVNGHVMVQVVIGTSKPLSFVFDTGDKFALVDLDRAKALGLNLGGEMSLHGAGGAAVRGAFVNGASWSFPTVKGFAQPVTLAIPLKELSSKLGRDFDGVIGADFIKWFVVEVDYQAQVLRLFDREKFSYSGSGKSIPIRLNRSGHPVFEATVTPIGGDPVTGDFVLDLGANLALQLQSAFVAEHHLPGPGVRTINRLGEAGVGGNVTGKIGRVASFKVGGYEFKSPVTMFQEGSTGPDHGEARIGSIGQSIAARFRVFLDYSHDRIILEPTAALNQPFNDASAGVHISADGSDYKTFRVAGLMDNAPGVEAGLKVGDIIQAIDGKKASEWTLTAILDLFRKPVAHKLSVLRGDQKLEITISPRQLI